MGDTADATSMANSGSDRVCGYADAAIVVVGMAFFQPGERKPPVLIDAQVQ